MSHTEQSESAAPVVVKKYANRRLYNTESSSYITLDNLAELIRGGRDFVVYDAKSGEDITRGVLTQIIVEEESKGRALLPTAFLRQLIGFYGDSLQALVPRYLEQAMANFAHQQSQMRAAMQQTMGNFFPFGMEEVGRQNVAMMERAMTLFAPFYRAGAGEAGAADAAGSDPSAVDSLEQELERLREEVEHLRAELLAKGEPKGERKAEPGGERKAEPGGEPRGEPKGEQGRKSVAETRPLRAKTTGD